MSLRRAAASEQCRFRQDAYRFFVLAQAGPFGTQQFADLTYWDTSVVSGEKGVWWCGCREHNGPKETSGFSALTSSRASCRSKRTSMLLFFFIAGTQSTRHPLPAG